MRQASLLVLTMFTMLTLTPPAAAQSSQTSPSSPAQRLHELFDDRFRWEMREFPRRAMEKGDYTYADRLEDVSLAAIERRREQTAQHLERLHTIDPAQLSEQDRINYALFELELTNAIEANKHRAFLAAVGGRFGPQQEIPQLADRVRFESLDDYQNYLQRLRQVPKLVDDTIELLRTGLAEGRTPPKVTLQGLPAQFHALIEGGGLAMLRAPIQKMPAHFTDDQKRELTERFDYEVFPLVRDAMAKLGTYFTEDYLPNARESIAAIDWPDGEAFYNFQLRSMTTTNLTAREIHEIGLREVARIRSEMMQVIRRSDFLEVHPEAKSLDDAALFKAFLHYLRTDPRFYYTAEADLLTGYRDICKQVDAWLPKFFGTLPRLPYGVKEIPRFMAPTQTTAYYQNGDIRNAEPGYFMANTYALDQRPKYEMIPLAMHEAVPGHHLQIALAQEMAPPPTQSPTQGEEAATGEAGTGNTREAWGVPEFRKDAYFIAFGEGWALYSERLGIEMGLYSDPYNDFGRLLYEMWRACRLVVDPGMHALGWSREQAVQFMLDNTALSELNINTEIDRYISWPGQATAYKIGELKIRELREHAEKTLGEDFDIRAFHDVVLGAGAVPLEVLERRVRTWVDNAAAPH